MIKKLIALILFCHINFANYFLGQMEIPEEFYQWKLVHNKNYDSIEEEQLRLSIFLQKKAEIDDHNSQGLTHQKGLNQWSDLTHEEWESLIVSKRFEKSFNMNYIKFIQKSVPDSLDWRKIGAVTSVKTQGLCGAGYAFAAIGALEGQAMVSQGVQKEFSVQQVLDCSNTDEFGNLGCGGGYVDKVFEYISKNGIQQENEYPYTNSNSQTVGNCQNPSCTDGKGIWNVNIYGCDQLVQAIQLGPISIKIDPVPLREYKSGILTDRYSCNATPYQTALLVGYGSEQGEDYWIIKNSWGTDWGEDGYLRILKDNDSTVCMCNIDKYASMPTNYHAGTCTNNEEKEEDV